MKSLVDFSDRSRKDQRQIRYWFADFILSLRTTSLLTKTDNYPSQINIGSPWCITEILICWICFLNFVEWTVGVSAYDFTNVPLHSCWICDETIQIGSKDDTNWIKAQNFCSGETMAGIPETPSSRAMSLLRFCMSWAINDHSSIWPMSYPQRLSQPYRIQDRTRKQPCSNQCMNR